MIDNHQETRRKTWSQMAEEMADGMVPPVVLVGGTLLHVFTMSTGIQLLFGVLTLVWLYKVSSSKSQLPESAPELEPMAISKPEQQKQPKEQKEQSQVKKQAETKREAVRNLFPAITDVTIQYEHELSAKSCSTGLTTRLLPFKNGNGEIEWAFTEDSTIQGSELDVFKIKQEKPVVAKKEEKNDLTPTTSNSSNADSVLSQPNGEIDEKHEENHTPFTNSPYSDDEDAKVSGEESKGGESGSDDSQTVYQCPHCEVSFKIRGYLTRHLKKHAAKKAYSCPFYKYSIYVDENNLTHKCHPSGGFSRRDTYKTHLKSRHFKYPKGVKTKERNTSPGYCSMCNEPFPSSEIWCEIHIEGGECVHLPQGFTGKSRIKNKLRKEQKRKEKENGLHKNNINGLVSMNSPSKTPSTYNTPQSYSYYSVPTMVSVNSPSFSPNSEILTSGTYMNTPVSIPYQVSPGTKMDHQMAVPPMPIQHQQSQLSQIQYQQSPYKQQPQMQPPHQFHQQFRQQFVGPEELPQFQQFSSHIMHKDPVMEDYDDDYCLDLDQLPIGNNGITNEIYN